MARPGQFSFRRILLSRILLLSVPILLLGVYVTYRKAGSSLQETARQNLTESAIKKGESINQSIETLSTSLATATETVVLQSGKPESLQKFVEQLAQLLPTQVQCVQLTDLQTRNIAASTCGNFPINGMTANPWTQQRNQLLLNRSNVHLTVLLLNKSPQTSYNNQLRLVLSSPVYRQGKLRYALSFQSALLKEENSQPGSLVGNTVVIDQDGTILAHPSPERVGGNIEEEEDKDRLKSLMKNAIAGKQKSLHLFSFGKNGVELLAGYTSINSPIPNQRNRKWVILAVQSRDNVLSDLSELSLVLFILVLGLIAASLLATMYLARDLARPVEKLRDYALNQGQLHSTEQVPHNFKISEFNQLAEAMSNMVGRLRAWAAELETAWKEAQTANQMKNEFLATTSHELRTPLNAIIGCIRLVRDGCCDDREEELDFLQRADDAAIHLLAIINDVLDLAKIEAGKLSVLMEPLDLRKSLKEVIDLQAVTIEQKGLEFNIPDLQQPIPVLADPAKLRQVLLNVVGNATKFTTTGSITITTRIEVGQETGEWGLVNGNYQSTISNSQSLAFRVAIAVKDTGIGIDPAEQHRLFRPFVMVDGTTTRQFGGTGLGLAISRNLIEMMAGSITLTSEGEGYGTTVEIVLPLLENSFDSKSVANRF